MAAETRGGKNSFLQVCPGVLVGASLRGSPRNGGRRGNPFASCPGLLMSLWTPLPRLTPGDKGPGHKSVRSQRRDSQDFSDAWFQVVKLGIGPSIKASRILVLSSFYLVNSVCILQVFFFSGDRI